MLWLLLLLLLVVVMILLLEEPPVPYATTGSGENDGSGEEVQYDAGDIEESFRLFQGHLLEVYTSLNDEFGLIQINANQTIEQQQNQVRKRLAKAIDLDGFTIQKLS